MPLLVERLADGHTWWRIAERSWTNPLDPGHADVHGGRWNAPGAGPTLYLNADTVTARLNLRTFIAGWPYEPEDLRDETGPVLIGARLPRNQHVCDCHSALGVVRAGLPPNYPRDENGIAIGHARCQPVGARVRAAGLRGIHARAAQTADGAGRELAWFPAGPRSRARAIERVPFEAWFRA